jgi:hypothetical protein
VFNRQKAYATIGALIVAGTISACSSSATSTASGTSNASNAIPQSCGYGSGGYSQAPVNIVIAKGLVCLTLQSILSRDGLIWTPFDGQPTAVKPTCILYQSEDGTMSVYNLATTTYIGYSPPDICGDEEALGWQSK